jgi:predicted nucleic acid-binding protein
VTSYVVDASVGAKWFLEEEYSDAARRLIQGSPRLIVPDLFFIEIGSVYSRKTRRQELEKEDATALLEALLATQLEVHSTLPLLSFSFDIALHCGCALYDALYLSLALRQGCRLVTADRRFVETASSVFNGYPIVWVNDLA